MYPRTPQQSGCHRVLTPLRGWQVSHSRLFHTVSLSLPKIGGVCARVPVTPSFCQAEGTGRARHPLQAATGVSLAGPSPQSCSAPARTRLPLSAALPTSARTPPFCPQPLCPPWPWPPSSSSWLISQACTGGQRVPQTLWHADGGADTGRGWREDGQPGLLIASSGRRGWLRRCW